MGALAPPRGGEWLLDLLVTLMLLKLLTLKRLRLLPLKKEKPLQPGHRLLQNLVLIGAGCLPLQLFCIMSNSSPDSRLGIGISNAQSLVEARHLKRRRQISLLFSPDWTLDAWRIATPSTRIELTRRRREEVGHGLHPFNRRRKVVLVRVVVRRKKHPPLLER